MATLLEFTIQQENKISARYEKQKDGTDPELNKASKEMKEYMKVEAEVEKLQNEKFWLMLERDETELMLSEDKDEEQESIYKQRQEVL
ncbi:MAG: hypothetical protein EZS28_041127, partial [Streblomastix strix]